MGKDSRIDIKKGVSQSELESSTTFGAISMLDALRDAGIGWSRCQRWSKSPMQAFYSTIKFGSYGPDAEGKPRPGLGINTPSKALIAEAGSRVGQRETYRQGRGTPSRYSNYSNPWIHRYV